jgi:hypothetical protein
VFSDIAFWKFFLLFSIRSAAINGMAQKEEK